MNNYKKILLIIFAVLLLLFPLIFIFKSKQKPDLKTTGSQSDIINVIISKNKKIENLLNSIKYRNILINEQKKLIGVLNKKPIVVYENAIKTAPDTCYEYLEAVYKSFYKSDSLKTNHILKQDSSLIDYENAVEQINDVVLLKNYQLQLSSDTINLLKDENLSLEKQVKTEKRKGNLKSLGYSVASFLAAIGISSLK